MNSTPVCKSRGSGYMSLMLMRAWDDDAMIHSFMFGLLFVVPHSSEMDAGQTQDVRHRALTHRASDQSRKAFRSRRREGRKFMLRRS
jgi:hypothetical protein